MRRGWRILALIGVLLLVMMIAVAWAAQRALQTAGVEQWHAQGLGWQDGGPYLQSLSLVQRSDQGLVELQLQGLSLTPGWQLGAWLKRLTLERVELAWWPAETLPEQPVLAFEDQPVPDPLAWVPLLAWAPEQLTVAELLLDLPCASGRCELDGQLTMQLMRGEPSSLVSQIVLNSSGVMLHGDVQLSAEAEVLRLETEWQLEQHPALALHSQWRQAEQEYHWQGWLSIPEWPGSEALFPALQAWLAPGLLPLDDLPRGLQATLGWDWQGEQLAERLGALLDGSARLGGMLRLQQPWLLDGVGLISGEQQWALEVEQRRWRLHQGQAQWRLQEPAAALFGETLPSDWLPKSLNLTLSPSEVLELDWASRLPFAARLEIDGPLAGRLQGQLGLTAQPQLRLELTGGQLELRAAALAWDDLRMREARLQAAIEAAFDGQRLSVQLGESSLARLTELALPELELHLAGVELGLPGLRLEMGLAEDGDWALEAPLRLGMTLVRHPQLKPQGWSFNGRLSQSPARLSLSGALASASGLAAELRFNWPEQADWQAELVLQELFLRAANPLAETLSAWPELLSFSTGRLQARFELGGADALVRADGQVRLSGGAGIYDRSSFEGLELPLSVRLRGEQLQLGFTELKVRNLDPGLPLGPLVLQGEYQASLERLEQGRLRLDSARLGMLGGQLWLEPGQLDLAASRQDLVLGLEGVELARLFEVYPAEGLSGRGTLDGRLPVSLENGKLLVEGGRVQAREPGGILQYQSAQLQAMGRSNPGMRELAVALEDFRYSVLSSDLDYGSDGVLVLALRLEGYNPDLQRGRPVHLNVRLEEDIPALLASLQLSGQVSDIIQKRVQERLLQRRLNP